MAVPYGSSSMQFGNYYANETCICPICGKKFLKPPESIYKLHYKGHLKYFCSYTCWMKAKREKGL